VFLQVGFYRLIDGLRLEHYYRGRLLVETLINSFGEMIETCTLGMVTEYGILLLSKMVLINVLLYLMMDKVTQEPVADWTDVTSFDFKKSLILMDLKDDCDVVNMAKANKKKKRKVKK
jgi:hypothetical protein